MGEIIRALGRDFEVVRMLGEGSFGQVYEVVDPATGRRAALKLLPLQGQGEREARELAASLKLDHPHLIRAYAGALEEGRAVLLLELAQGSLQDQLRHPGRQAASWELLRQAARGAAALHAVGLVHRDLKPANVLLVGGVAKVADLGMVRGGDLETLTRTGTILGSPAYMAPEQARGETLGPTADAWAMGVMAYELVEGQLPYPDEGLASLLHRVSKGQVADFARGKGLLAPETLALLRQALSPAPADRPRDLAAWADALGPWAPRAAPTRRRDLTLDIAGTVPDSAAGSREAVTAEVQVEPERTRSVHGSPPRTAPPPAPASRLRPLALGAALLLVAVGFGVLTGPERPVTPEGGVPPTAPGHSPDVSARGAPEADAPPPYSDSPFGAAYVTRLEQLVADMPRVPPTSFSAANLEVPENPMKDPWRWRLAVQEHPDLRAFYAWMRAGHDPRRLPPAHAEVLRGLDEFFADEGWPRPFFPYLYLEPAREAVPLAPSSARWLAERTAPTDESARVMPAQASGWLGTAYRAAERLDATLWPLVEEFAQLRDGGAVGPALTFLATASPEAQEEGEMPDFYAELLDVGRFDSAIRRVMARHLHPAAEAMHELLYALSRAMVEEPQHAEASALLASYLSWPQRPALYGHLIWLHPADILGRELPTTEEASPPEALLLARLATELVRAQSELGGQLLGLRSSYCARAMDDPGDPPGSRWRARACLDSRLRLLFREDEPNCRAVVDLYWPMEGRGSSYHGRAFDMLAYSVAACGARLKERLTPGEARRLHSLLEGRPGAEVDPDDFDPETESVAQVLAALEARASQGED